MNATDDPASAVTAAASLAHDGAMPSGLSAIASPLPLSNRLLSKPFIDRLCLWGFRWLLPASHAWAIAAKANGNVEQFAHALQISGISSNLSRALRQTAALRLAAEQAFDVWQDAAFTLQPTMTAEALAGLEVLRRRTAQAFSAQRRAYLWFGHKHKIPAASYRIPQPDAALAPFLDNAANLHRLFAAPRAMPEIDVSRRGVVDGVAEYWLRFRSPAVADVIGDGGETAWVHVYEPLDASKAIPSLIWAHGLAMELEMMESGPVDFLSLARAGIRILMPDGPGHNRRVQSGLYGGESFLREAPISGLHHFSQAGSEFASLIDWCRQQGNGKVALGGISLGALSAQVAVGHMGDWPEQCKPDALLLLTSTDRVSALVTESALGQVADVDRVVLAAGWREKHVETLAMITDAKMEPPLDPSRIVLMLGRRDNVTPYAGGLRLARQWQLPAANIFTRDQGHFSAAFGLAVDPAPYYRLIDILKG